MYCIALKRHLFKRYITIRLPYCISQMVGVQYIYGEMVLDAAARFGSQTGAEVGGKAIEAVYISCIAI